MINLRENEVEPYEERSDDDEDERVLDDRPEVLMTKFPTSIIVLSLEEQLGKGNEGYGTTDFLTPILDRFRVIEDRIPDDTSFVKKQLTMLRHQTYLRITNQVSEDIDIDFDELHLDIGTADDWERVEEIYRFFCLYRQRNIENIIYEIISINKEDFANQYRHETTKKNQSIREVRKILKKYDDVIVYINFHRIVDGLLKQKDDLDLPLEGCLELLNDTSPVPDEGYIQRMALYYTDTDFLAKYLEPLEHELIKTKTIINGKQKWLEECEKK